VRDWGDGEDGEDGKRKEMASPRLARRIAKWAQQDCAPTTENLAADFAGGHGKERWGDVKDWGDLGDGEDGETGNERKWRHRESARSGAAGICNSEPGTRNSELGTWNLELGLPSPHPRRRGGR
jgi:hypothetical protein